MIFDLLDYFLGFFKVILYKVLFIKRFSFSINTKYSKDFHLRLSGKSSCYIGRSSVIRSGVWFRSFDKGIIKIGNGCGFNNNCLINCKEMISIGDNTILGQGVMIYDHDHNYKTKELRRKSGFKSSPVIIGNNVWVGSGCIILKGARIGDNCVVAAGSIVRGDIPNDSIIYNEKKLVIKEID